MYLSKSKAKRLVAQTKIKIDSPEYNGILDDLVAFTGLTEAEVLYRIARKDGHNGARGWFDVEWDWHNPQSNSEISWFYKSSQSYLFSNARHPYWTMIDRIPDVCDVILDYGGGVGTNSVELCKRGKVVFYYDVSIIQREFMKFRVEYRHYSNIDIFENDADIHPPDIILFQDVLEHVPNYSKLLNRICSDMFDGTYILERSPFRPQGHKPNQKLKMHLEADKPLRKVMKQNGMKLVDTFENNTHLWIKE